MTRHRFMVVPAAFVFLLRDGDHGREVLLQLRHGTGFMDDHWAAAVAGHVERGESVRAAARREALEEVGVTDLGLVPWCVVQRTRPGDDPLDERVDYVFIATTWSGVPAIQEPDKTADLGWFTLDALPTPVVPHELAVLETIRAGGAPPILSLGFDPDED